MNKKYFSVLLLFGLLFSVNNVFSQVNIDKPNSELAQNIDGLAVYPNPVSTGKIYISTASNHTKEINIYDVLGKKIMSQTLFSKELNISELRPGVYILKIKENEISATRKLVVR